MTLRHGATQWWQVVMRMYLSIINSISKEEAKNITVEDFKKIKLDEMLTNRQTGSHEMVKMLRKI